MFIVVNKLRTLKPLNIERKEPSVLFWSRDGVFLGYSRKGRDATGRTPRRRVRNNFYLHSHVDSALLD